MSPDDRLLWGSRSARSFEWNPQPGRPLPRKSPETLPRARLLHGLLDCLHGGELFLHLLLPKRGETCGELGFRVQCIATNGGFLNGGTPKSSILTGFSLTNHPFWDTPMTMETSMSNHGSLAIWSLSASWFEHGRIMKNLLGHQPQYHCAWVRSYSSHLHGRATPVHSSPNSLNFWSYFPSNFPMVCWIMIGSCLHIHICTLSNQRASGFWQYIVEILIKTLP